MKWDRRNPFTIENLIYSLIPFYLSESKRTMHSSIIASMVRTCEGVSLQSLSERIFGIYRYKYHRAENKGSPVAYMYQSAGKWQMDFVCTGSAAI